MDETIETLKHSLRNYEKRKLILIGDLEDGDDFENDTENKSKLEKGIKKELELMGELKYVKNQLKDRQDSKRRIKL